MSSPVTELCEVPIQGYGALSRGNLFLAFFQQSKPSTLFQLHFDEDTASFLISSAISYMCLLGRLVDLGTGQ